MWYDLFTGPYGKVAWRSSKHGDCCMDALWLVISGALVLVAFLCGLEAVQTKRFSLAIASVALILSCLQALALGQWLGPPARGGGGMGLAALGDAFIHFGFALAFVFCVIPFTWSICAVLIGSWSLWQTRYQTSTWKPVHIGWLAIALLIIAYSLPLGWHASEHYANSRMARDRALNERTGSQQAILRIYGEGRWRDYDLGHINRLVHIPHLPAAIAEDLARNAELPHARHDAARHPSLSPDQLTQLAALPDPWVCRGVICNKKTPTTTLTKMLDHSDRSVAISVASALIQKRDTPTHTLLRATAVLVVAKQSVHHVAKHPNFHGEVLQHLLEFDDLYARLSLAKFNPLPVAIQWRLAHDENPHIQMSLAKNPCTDAEVLRVLAQSEHTEVRHAVTSHMNSPDDVLQHLTTDSDERTAHDAAQALRQRKREHITAD